MEVRKIVKNVIVLPWLEVSERQIGDFGKIQSMKWY